MIISKDSWHYKFTSWIFNHLAGVKMITDFEYDINNGYGNLCWYVRQVLKAAFIALISGAFFSAIIVGVCLAVAVPIISIVQGLGLTTYLSNELMEFGWFLSGVYSLIVFYYITKALVKKAVKFIRSRRKYVQKLPKQPNVFIQYVKDRHNKFCRTIEVK